MAETYFANNMNEQATFELFVRGLPPQRNFLVACGLDLALQFLESLEFSQEDITYLDSLGILKREFLDFLSTLEFTGDVWAVPEGEIVFQQEPLIRITAPMIEAQVVETYLLNCIGYSTSVASKAARVTLVCEGRAWVDFGARRAHGGDASMLAARAAVIGGAQGTSNVLAAKLYGLDVSGTMAHSLVQAFRSEQEAFVAFGRQFPERAVFLIDTFDTLEGARVAASVADELKKDNIKVRAVRLDSGDLRSLSIEVRQILDGAGVPDIQIFASGDLDEYRIAELLDGGAPIDAFGVGTQLVTSADVPALSVAYKLVEDQMGPKFKLSKDKRSYPWAKQVYRSSDGDAYSKDVVAPQTETLEGQPLLQQVMTSGARSVKAESINELQERCLASVKRLPESLLSLGPGADPYPVELHPALSR
jgi:nicotinate phosphoribosyltransferase